MTEGSVKMPVDRRMSVGLRILAIAVLGAVVMLPTGAFPQGRPPDRLNHVIVIYRENWSFDGLYSRDIVSASRMLPTDVWGVQRTNADS